MKLLALLALPILLISSAARAQGCPVGQYQIGGQGAVACAPIPQGTPVQQDPRPSGRWIKTWGAIAMDDDGANIGVSTGILKKFQAEKDAVTKCEGESQKKCRAVISYQNQCVSVARPNTVGSISFIRGPYVKDTSKDALLDCRKKNNNNECSVIYENCTQQIFEYF
ncbi:DUF4189 domain-containing protein [Xanthomonas campestris]|uniref:DUF4189 domain-containing protein n=1 Tax=Xanthomonas campestris TaxID=339 RepID=UPI000E1E553A|nr:DUF4189 domain-containing protein [Xanthomonas campestris]